MYTHTIPIDKEGGEGRLHIKIWEPLEYMIMMKTVHKIWINGDGQICPDGHSAILVLRLLLYNDSCMHACGLISPTSFNAFLSTGLTP